MRCGLGVGRGGKPGRRDWWRGPESTRWSVGRDGDVTAILSSPISQKSSTAQNALEAARLSPPLRPRVGNSPQCRNSQPGMYPPASNFSPFFDTEFNASRSGLRLRAPRLRVLSRCVLRLIFRVNAVSEGVFVFQSLVNSRVTLASATLLSVGSIAWYTHLYGSLPFLGQVYASDPAEDGLHPPAYPWPHKGLLDSFDHARYVHQTPSCLHPANLQPVPQHPERLRRLP